MSRNPNSTSPDFTPITWRLHLASPPERVYALLATDAGRARFWAERAEERDGHIHFVFPNGYQWAGRILAAEPPRRFALDYLGHSTTMFELVDDGAGGADLTEVTAGLASVLLALKAAADFGVDLRNHDARRTWDAGFVEN